MLYAVWILEDLERVDALVQRGERLQAGWMTYYGVNKPEQLNREQEAFSQQLNKPLTPSSGMPVDKLLTFPGMPNYRKGPVS